jgi:predicted dehydrogenase
LKPVKIGVIGCGNISDVYLESCRSFEILELVSCASRTPERARRKAEQHGIPRWCSVAELLADPEIDIVLDLTVPGAHAEIALAALDAGKSVYNEKPLAVTRRQASEILARAAAANLRVGCAPDTFLGGGLQTCRKLIDDGRIGEPVAATVMMLSHGPESWHPDPGFLYDEGAGPMFDMGPYYLTTLCALVGPVRRVTGLTRTTFPERVITSEPRRGERIEVRTPTHVAGLLELANRAVVTVVTSFDVWEPYDPLMVVYGTEGSLRVPDANTFGGPVGLRIGGEEGWNDVPLSHGFVDNHRGIGLADMAYALRSGRPHRAGGDMAFHVLDVMHAIHEASERGRQLSIESSCDRPEPLPETPGEPALDG